MYLSSESPLRTIVLKVRIQSNVALVTLALALSLAIAL